MKVISNKTRTAIDSIVVQLSDVAKAVKPANPTLAAIYRCIGKGVDGSHIKFQKRNSLHFEFPAGCVLNVSGSDFRSIRGPVTLNVTVD